MVWNEGMGVGGLYYGGWGVILFFQVGILHGWYFLDFFNLNLGRPSILLGYCRPSEDEDTGTSTWYRTLW
jgi:hypothetical protein